MYCPTIKLSKLQEYFQNLGCSLLIVYKICMPRFYRFANLLSDMILYIYPVKLIIS